MSRPWQLGAYITFLAELSTLSKVYHTGTEVAFIGAVDLCGRSLWQQLDQKNCVDKPPIYSLPWIFADMKRLWAVQAPAVLSAFLHYHGDAFFWPPVTYPDHDTTLITQMLFRQYAVKPQLELSHTMRHWAGSFFKKYTNNRMPIVIHLKQNQLPGNSNANLDAWWKFLRPLQYSHEYSFFIIGNEAIGSKFDDLKNVTITKNLKLNLMQELSLLRSGAAFMGMSSGPANMAIFSNLPYVIFKHPDHHAAKMKGELVRKQQFIFATAAQKFYRDFDSAPNLAKGWQHLASLASAYWRKQANVL